MKFTEEKLEQAVIELFGAEGYKHLTADQIHKKRWMRLCNTISKTPYHSACRITIECHYTTTNIV
jgi:hypothetical protein